MSTPSWPAPPPPQEPQPHHPQSHRPSPQQQGQWAVPPGQQWAPHPGGSTGPLPPRRGLSGGVIALIVGGILLVILLAVAGVGYLLWSSSQAPVRVADDLVDAIQAGNGAEAYELFGPEGRRVSSQFQVQLLASRIGPQLTGEEEVTGRHVSTRTGQGTVATVLYRAPRTTGGNAYLKVVLRKYDGEWKVVSFQSSPTPLSAD